MEADYHFDIYLGPSKDIKTYVEKGGYIFKNLGTAPAVIRNIKAVKNKDKVKVIWKPVTEADGYIITYSDDFYGIRNETVIKDIKNSKKKSYNFKKNILKGKEYIHIKAYKIINGIKVCGKSACTQV